MTQNFGYLIGCNIEVSNVSMSVINFGYFEGTRPFYLYGLHPYNKVTGSLSVCLLILGQLHFFKLPLGAKPLEARGEAASLL